MRQGASDVVPFRKRTLRTLLVALGLSVAVAAVPAVASAGLWVGGDTNRIGGETRRRIALMAVP